MFGSTSEVGQGPGVIPAPVSPGPGTYESRAPTAEEDGVTLARLRRKETSAFASTSDRFNQSEGRATTAGSGGGRRAASAADRTMSNDEERPSRGGRVEVPPGAYEVPGSMAQKTRSSSTHGGFHQQRDALPRAQADERTGPGTGTIRGCAEAATPYPCSVPAFRVVRRGLNRACRCRQVPGCTNRRIQTRPW